MYSRFEFEFQADHDIVSWPVHLPDSRLLFKKAHTIMRQESILRDYARLAHASSLHVTMMNACMSSAFVRRHAKRKGVSHRQNITLQRCVYARADEQVAI